MKKIYMLIILISLILFSACTNNQNAQNDELIILTTFYPVEEITKAIVLDTVSVKVLIPTGAEPHSYEPTPRLIVELSKVQVFVTMEGMFESIEESILKANSKIKVIDAAHNLDLIYIDEDEHEEENHKNEYDNHENGSDEHEHEDFDYDPHVWLSINNMKTMTEKILEELIEIYPENKDFYEQNAQIYLKKLDELQIKFNQRLLNCNKKEIIVNHLAFGYLAKDYGFEQISVAGFSPQSEPTPKNIQNVIDKAKEYNLKYVFSEGQLDPKFAQTIARDINGEVLELNPIKLNDNEDYFSIMENNLENLAKGLECN